MAPPPPPGSRSETDSHGDGLPAQRAEGVRHGVAALQQSVQPVRLLLQELDGLHLHPEHHAHLALQAGELVCEQEPRGT